MIVVELSRPKIGDPFSSEPAARLAVDDRGGYTVTGAAELFEFTLPVYDAGRSAFVTFAEDPQAWARNLRTELRTPYLTATVVTDTARGLDPDTLAPVNGS